MKTYKPTDVDIAWAKNMVAITCQSGTWVWPDTGLIYSFDHQAKTLTLINPEMLTNSIADKFAEEGHQRTVEVFKAVGYTVKE